MVKHHFQSGIEFATHASKKGYGAIRYTDWVAGYLVQVKHCKLINKWIRTTTTGKIKTWKTGIILMC